MTPERLKQLIEELKSIDGQVPKSGHHYFMKDKQLLVCMILLIDRFTDLRDYLESISNDMKTFRWMGNIERIYRTKKKEP